MKAMNSDKYKAEKTKNESKKTPETGNCRHIIDVYNRSFKNIKGDLGLSKQKLYEMHMLKFREHIEGKAI
eukprot:8770999-Ditylum_brightwellii.AAC.1